MPERSTDQVCEKTEGERADAAALSVILITPDSYGRIRRTIGCLQAQTVRDRLELAIVMPSAEAWEAIERDVEVFCRFRIVEIGEFNSLAQAMAAGARAATAPVVAYAEDHVFPDSDWAAALIDAHRGRWSAVGPVVRNANPVRGLLRTPKLIWDVLLRGRYHFVYDQIPVSVCRMSPVKRINLFRAGANLAYRRLQPWSWPLHMQAELTSFCNLKCPVCPVGAQELTRQPLAMDVGLFERFMAEVGPYLLTLSLWGWGESLLHPRLADMLRIAARYPVVTLVSTNGQNLKNRKIIEALTQYSPTHLIVALDGLSDETLCWYRVGAKFDRIMAGVHDLVQAKAERGLDLPVPHMRYIVMKHNQHELPQLQDFAKAHGFEFLTVRALVIMDSPASKHRELEPDFNEFKAYEYARRERVRRSDFICQQPFWFPTVFADGTVVACEQDFNAQLPLGVLTPEVSFADVWFGEQAIKVRRIIRDQPDTLSFCRQCPFADCAAEACSVQGFALASRRV